MNATQPKMLSAAEMSRMANIPANRFLKNIRMGFTTPDAVAMDGRLFLFKPSRLEEIKAKFAEESLAAA
jgi:hypothetical protein